MTETYSDKSIHKYTIKGFQDVEDKRKRANARLIMADHLHSYPGMVQVIVADSHEVTSVLVDTDELVDCLTKLICKRREEGRETK